MRKTKNCVFRERKNVHLAESNPCIRDEQYHFLKSYFDSFITLFCEKLFFVLKTCKKLRFPHCEDVVKEM